MRVARVALMVLTEELNAGRVAAAAGVAPPAGAPGRGSAHQQRRQREHAADQRTPGNPVECLHERPPPSHVTVTPGMTRRFTSLRRDGGLTEPLGACQPPAGPAPGTRSASAGRSVRTMCARPANS